MNYDDILKFLPLLVNVITEGVSLVDRLTNDIKQNAELTPDQEKAFDAIIAAKEASPAWQVQD